LVLRLPSFLQTWWYVDENIYMAIGQAITKGQWLYVDAWDHKPPMIYLVYALSYWLFGNSLWPLRLLNAILAFLGVVAFYWLSSRLFGLSTRTSQVLAVVYTFALNLVFEGPVFNAENWFMPLIWLGLVCLVIGLNLLKPLAQPQFGWWLLGSVLWSLAAFSKMHAVLEIAILTLVLIVIYGQQQLSLTTDNPNSTGSTLTKLVNLSKTWVTQLVSQTQFWRYFGSLVGLMVLPYLVTGALYWFNGYWPDFYFAVWGYNQDYITYAANSVILFGFNLSEWSVSGNQLHLFLLSLWLVTSSWLLLQHHFSQRFLVYQLAGSSYVCRLVVRTQLPTLYVTSSAFRSFGFRPVKPTLVHYRIDNYQSERHCFQFVSFANLYLHLCPRQFDFELLLTKYLLFRVCQSSFRSTRAFQVAS